MQIFWVSLHQIFVHVLYFPIPGGAYPGKVHVLYSAEKISIRFNFVCLDLVLEHSQSTCFNFFFFCGSEGLLLVVMVDQDSNL